MIQDLLSEVHISRFSAVHIYKHEGSYLNFQFGSQSVMTKVGLHVGDERIDKLFGFAVWSKIVKEWIFIVKLKRSQTKAIKKSALNYSYTQSYLDLYQLFLRHGLTLSSSTFCFHFHLGFELFFINKFISCFQVEITSKFFWFKILKKENLKCLSSTDVYHNGIGHVLVTCRVTLCY